MFNQRGKSDSEKNSSARVKINHAQLCDSILIFLTHVQLAKSIYFIIIVCIITCMVV